MSKSVAHFSSAFVLSHGTENMNREEKRVMFNRTTQMQTCEGGLSRECASPQLSHLTNIFISMRV